MSDSTRSGEIAPRKRLGIAAAEGASERIGDRGKAREPQRSRGIWRIGTGALRGPEDRRQAQRPLQDRRQIAARRLGGPRIGISRGRRAVGLAGGVFGISEILVAFRTSTPGIVLRPHPRGPSGVGLSPVVVARPSPSPPGGITPAHGLVGQSGVIIGRGTWVERGVIIPGGPASAREQDRTS